MLTALVHPHLQEPVLSVLADSLLALFDSVRALHTSDVDETAYALSLSHPVLPPTLLLSLLRLLLQALQRNGTHSETRRLLSSSLLHFLQHCQQPTGYQRSASASVLASLIHLAR